MIIIYPYKIVTCHIRAYEVSKCTFALTTRSISAGQKSCIAVNTGFLTCYGTFYDVTTRDVSYINKIYLFARRSDWPYYYATTTEQCSQSAIYGWVIFHI